MIIDVIDMGDPIIASGVPAALDAACAVTTRIQLSGMCNGVSEMLSQISSAAGPGQIDALRIWDHGMAGVQMVTGGQGYPGARNDNVAITNDNFTQLSPLTPLFSPSGRVELRGCSVAAGGAGRALLLNLASMWNVPVYASDVEQGSGDWTPPVTCGYPNGNLSTVPGPMIVDGNDIGPEVPDPSADGASPDASAGGQDGGG